MKKILVVILVVVGVISVNAQFLEKGIRSTIPTNDWRGIDIEYTYYPFNFVYKSDLGRYNIHTTNLLTTIAINSSYFSIPPYVSLIDSFCYDFNKNIEFHNCVRVNPYFRNLWLDTSYLSNYSYYKINDSITDCNIILIPHNEGFDMITSNFIKDNVEYLFDKYEIIYRKYIPKYSIKYDYTTAYNGSTHKIDTIRVDTNIIPYWIYFYDTLFVFDSLFKSNDIILNSIRTNLYFTNTTRWLIDYVVPGVGHIEQGQDFYQTERFFKDMYSYTFPEGNTFPEGPTTLRWYESSLYRWIYVYKQRVDTMSIRGIVLENINIHYKKNHSNNTALLETNDLDFFIYPNPITNNINLDFKEDMDRQITIYNSLGQKMFNLIITRDAQINFSNYSKGIYYIRIQEKDKIYTKKIVKE